MSDYDEYSDLGDNSKMHSICVTGKTIEEINEPKNLFLRKSIRIDKLLERHRRRTQSTGLRGEHGGITVGIKRTLGGCCEQMCANQFDSLGEIHQPLKHTHLSRSTEEKISNLNNLLSTRN